MRPAASESTKFTIAGFPRDSLYQQSFFVLRTPLLPVEELLAFSQDLEAAASYQNESPLGELDHAVERDAAKLRDRLRSLFQRQDIREALFIASPSLEERLQMWERDPVRTFGKKIETALLRYFARMCGRATPFGFFAGCSAGIIAKETNLKFDDRTSHRRGTRLDGAYLGALCRELLADEQVRRELRYYPNSSIYRAAGRMRYIEDVTVGAGHGPFLIGVEETPHLLSALGRSAGGVTLDSLAQGLCDDDPELDLTEAGRFVSELASRQILTAALAMPVTGRQPIEGLIDGLAGLQSPTAKKVHTCLKAVHRALARLDETGVGVSPQRYREIAQYLRALPAKVDISQLFQADLIKSSPQSTIAEDVLVELKRGIELLRLFSNNDATSGLRRFRDEFRRRYGDSEVPLCEALDEECGLGFKSGFPGGGAGAPLSSKRDALLLRKLVEAERWGQQTIHLDGEDAGELRGHDLPPLPDSFAAMASVFGRGAELRVRLDRITGPSGVNLLGRFCHADKALAQNVSAHLRAEEALQPSVIFAEIVHLPEDRMINVLSRPALRRHEIVLFGKGCGPRDDQIRADDLLISVRGDRIALRSARFNKEIVPRLTSAHNFADTRNIGLYRFLGALQKQGLSGDLSFHWGVLASAPFLPRVMSGRLVLSPARWNLNASQIQSLNEQTPAGRYRAIQTLRKALGLPRWVTIVEADNYLPLDLDNTLSIEMGVQLLKARKRATLAELDLSLDELCAESPEGHFVHEIIVPFVRTASKDDKPAMPLPGPLPSNISAETERRFVPGSKWLYAKLYTGKATADEVLRLAVRPAVDFALSSGAATHWFFVRYGDPDWHLRVRICGAPRRLTSEILPAFYEYLQPLLADGCVSRLQFDTYDRELERYGGNPGASLSEQLFYADSEAALSIVECFEGHASQDVYWKLCLCGIDRLMEDLGLDLETRKDLASRGWDFLSAKSHFDDASRRQRSARYRSLRHELEKLFESSGAGEGWPPLDQGLAILRKRSAALVPLSQSLHAAERDGKLLVPVKTLAGSYIHMHANRMLRTPSPGNELMLYGFLMRLYKRASSLRCPRRISAEPEAGI